MQTAVVYIATLLGFVALDVAWLGLFAISFFASEIGGLLRAQPNLVAAAAFYLIHATGLVALVVRPALRSGTLATVLSTGALFGLCAYATFDLTNLAVIKGWTLPVTLADMAWGTIGSAAACAFGYGAGRWWAGRTPQVEKDLSR